MALVCRTKQHQWHFCKMWYIAEWLKFPSLSSRKLWFSLDPQKVPDLAVGTLLHDELAGSGSAGNGEDLQIQRGFNIRDKEGEVRTVREREKKRGREREKRRERQKEREHLFAAMPFLKYQWLPRCDFKKPFQNLWDYLKLPEQCLDAPVFSWHQPPCPSWTGPLLPPYPGSPCGRAPSRRHQPLRAIGPWNMYLCSFNDHSNKLVVSKQEQIEL
jgi:hypothetical protein